MKYSREQYSNFLSMELCAVTENYEKKFTACASYLLNTSEELFIGIFLKIEKGEMIVKFRGTRPFPRKGEYIYSMYIPSELQDYRKWDDVTYEDLFKKRIKGTQAICIWYSKAKEKGFVLGGFRGIDNDFASYINQASGAMLVFGPDRPPIEYLANLYRIAQNNNSIGIQSILDKNFENKQNIISSRMKMLHDISWGKCSYMTL